MIRFEEQVTILRERLAHIHEQNEEFAQAAKILSEIPLEGTGRYEMASMSDLLTPLSVLTPEYKGNIYVKIAQLYLEEEESVNAETYINRASGLMPDVKDPMLILRFKVRSTAAPYTYAIYSPALLVSSTISASSLKRQ